MDSTVKRCAELHKVAVQAVNSGNYKDHSGYEGSFTDKFVAAVPGKVVVDCGACWGYYSTLALWAGCRKLYTFEPNEKQHGQFLRESFSTDSRVEFIGSALSDQLGTRKLWTSVSRPMQSWSAFKGKRDGESITVTCTTLDNAVSNADIIKCDTEGDELTIFHGAQRLLQDCKPTIFLELTLVNKEPVCQYASMPVYNNCSSAMVTQQNSTTQADSL